MYSNCKLIFPLQKLLTFQSCCSSLLKMNNEKKQVIHKVLGFIIPEPLVFPLNFITVHQTVVGILHSGLKDDFSFTKGRHCFIFRAIPVNPSGLEKDKLWNRVKRRAAEVRGGKWLGTNALRYAGIQKRHDNLLGRLCTSFPLCFLLPGGDIDWLCVDRTSLRSYLTWCSLNQSLF